MKLVIVESPAKCKTIGKYLGDEYKVVASYGHIRDLATTGKGGLGVDIDDDFKPSYVVSKEKTKTVAELKKLKKMSDEVILATDPDREGEAIAWHLADVLKLDVTTTKRLEFHEITKPAILKALDNPRIIDMNLVVSQEARRIIDRIMGFKLSGLLQKKIKSRSAGRVQSVTLKLLVDHEEEIRKFVSEEYWSMDAYIKNNSLKASLETYLGKTFKISSKEESDKVLSELTNELTVNSIKKNLKKRESKPPFTTSTMQQASFVRYHYSTKKTSLLAQHLYEGIDIGTDTVGLITYIRSDSTRLSPDFIGGALNYIEKEFGKEYLGQVKVSKSKNNIQDAHEAIRPTNLELTPKSIKKYLKPDEYNLYSLIYNRALASLMAPRIDEITTVLFNNGSYGFKIDGSILKFKGFSIIDDDEAPTELQKLVPFEEGEKIVVDKYEPLQHFTKAPNRYSEAKIVKLMEELGIGRPSTYSSTIDTLNKRLYVTSEKGILTPTEQGELTVHKLLEFFKEFMDPSYTATMEKSLDEIVSGNSSRHDLLISFNELLTDELAKAYDGMEKILPTETGEMCPDCGKPLVTRKGRFGSFVACSGYPECKYVKKEPKEIVPIDPNGPKCPKCGKPLVQRFGKRGPFLACSGFPDCKYIEGAKEKAEPVKTGTNCPNCGSPIIIKHGRFGDFNACSNYPSCKYIEKKVKKESHEDPEN